MLDRCGRHFGLVLNFLRDGSVPLPEDSRELEEVLKEAQYYRVQGLVQHCQNAMQVLYIFLIPDLGSKIYLEFCLFTCQSGKTLNCFNIHTGKVLSAK